MTLFLSLYLGSLKVLIWPSYKPTRMLSSFPTSVGVNSDNIRGRGERKVTGALKVIGNGGQLAAGRSPPEEGGVGVLKE